MPIEQVLAVTYVCELLRGRRRASYVSLLRGGRRASYVSLERDGRLEKAEGLAGNPWFPSRVRLPSITDTMSILFTRHFTPVIPAAFKAVQIQCLKKYRQYRHMKGAHMYAPSEITIQAIFEPCLEGKGRKAAGTGLPRCNL